LGKKRGPQRGRVSEVEISWGSAICKNRQKKVYLQIVEQVQKRYPQYEITRTLIISSSAVNKNIKRFRNTAENQYWKPVIFGHLK